MKQKCLNHSRLLNKICFQTSVFKILTAGNIYFSVSGITGIDIFLHVYIMGLSQKQC